jgi:hypothetical protein
MEPTRVMTLGNVAPQWRTGFMNPPVTTPQQPHNLLRPSVMNGLGQLNITTPGITPAQLTTPAIFPGSGAFTTPTLGPAAFHAQTPALGPGAFKTPGLDPAALQLFGLGDENGLKTGNGNYVGWGLIGTASMAASAWHGYRRNRSVGWAIWWALMGAMFPVVTPVIGVAQGWGKRKGRS